MCVSIFCVDKEEISTMGELEKYLNSADFIYLEHFGSDFHEECCLCPVDIPKTLHKFNKTFEKILSGDYFIKGQTSFRPFVKWVAEKMEASLKIKDNEDYPDWETETHQNRYELMHDDWWDVQEALKPCCIEETRTPEAITNLQEKLVGLALTAMMLCGGFDEEMSKLRRGKVIELTEREKQVAEQVLWSALEKYVTQDI